MGPFNAIQVRRKDHIDKKLTASYWLDRMLALNFSTSLPLYIASDHYDEEWFRLFHSQGFRIFVAQDFSEILNFTFLPKRLQSDYLGIHEQCICELAVQQFVPSPASTFAALILHKRGEVEKRDELMVDTAHPFGLAIRQGIMLHHDLYNYSAFDHCDDVILQYIIYTCGENDRYCTGHVHTHARKFMHASSCVSAIQHI